MALKIVSKICENFENFKNFEFCLENLLKLKNYWLKNSYFKLGDIISATKLTDESCIITGILIDLDNNGNIILQENSQDKLIIINSSEFKTIRKL